MREHVDDLIAINLYQTEKSVDIFMGVYKDFMLQLYTDDEIIAYINSLDSERDHALIINRIRRRLNGLIATKPEILCISLITPTGVLISYDKISDTTTTSSWLDSDDIPSIYKTISSRNNTTQLKRFDKVQFAEKHYDLVHIGHRMIDYKKIQSDSGVIIISLDESFISNIYTEDEKYRTLKNIVNFIHNDSMQILSFPDKKYIGYELNRDIPPLEAYSQVLKNSNIISGDRIVTKTVLDENTGWTIVSAADLSSLYKSINSQQRITFIMMFITTMLLFSIIFLISKGLTSNISKIVNSMVQAGKGDFQVQIDMVSPIPKELKPIAFEFNGMINRIKILIEEVKSVSLKQKETELRFLESQINPHFLYNILDSINWMAIEHEEYEISKMLTSLAIIFRYSIDVSNHLVTVEEDTNWLKEYIVLQEIRCKYSFKSEIFVEQNTNDIKIHKMLIQPFVENSIIHGFGGITCEGKLFIRVYRNSDDLIIEISDNGTGISKEIQANINCENSEDETIGIGMKNAIHRIRIYYGNEAKVSINRKTQGTTVVLGLPIIKDKKPE